MQPADDFQTIIDRISHGEHTLDDLVVLKNAFLPQRIRIEAAAGGVRVGGNAPNAIIVTGSSNTISRGADAEMIITALRHEWGNFIDRFLLSQQSADQPAEKPIAPVPFLFPEAT